MIKYLLLSARWHIVELSLWLMIKHLLSSAEEFALLHFHLIWMMFLSVSATVININSIFLQEQISFLVSTTVVNVDSMFLQKQMFFLVSTIVVDLDSMFLQKSMSFQVSMIVINLDSMFLQEQMFFWREITTFWNHH